MKYKVGDKVKIRLLDCSNGLIDNGGMSIYFTTGMEKYCGLTGIVKHKSVGFEMYRIFFDGVDSEYWWQDWMFEDSHTESNQESCEHCENYYYYLEDGYYYPLENKKYCAVCGRKLNKQQ